MKPVFFSFWHLSWKFHRFEERTTLNLAIMAVQISVQNFILFFAFFEKELSSLYGINVTLGASDYQQGMSIAILPVSCDRSWSTDVSLQLDYTVNSLKTVKSFEQNKQRRVKTTNDCSANHSANMGVSAEKENNENAKTTNEVNENQLFLNCVAVKNGLLEERDVLIQALQLYSVHCQSSDHDRHPQGHHQ